MGLTRVTVSVRDQGKRKRPYVADFLVDTGVVDCPLPAGRLKKAGIVPEGRAVYELADGTPVEYEYGFARVSFMDAETVAQAIFGPEDAEPILGVVALKNAGIGVDPPTKRLLKLAAKLLK